MRVDLYNGRKTVAAVVVVILLFLPFDTFSSHYHVSLALIITMSLQSF